jgi:hypothetical protein
MLTLELVLLFLRLRNPVKLYRNATQTTAN